nr:MAG TPA: hypothetical protein [Caudoviricetes sp.]
MKSYNKLPFPHAKSLVFAGLFIVITKATPYRVALIMVYTLHGIT